MKPQLIVLGWREWLAIPDLGIAAIKAKVDTGARSSSLHVESLEEVERKGQTWLKFAVATDAARNRVVTCIAPALDRRTVTDSSGHTAQRWFIRAAIVIAAARWEVEINLTDRCNMLFPMLLGRTALRGRFVVDSALSYCCGRPARERGRARSRL